MVVVAKDERDTVDQQIDKFLNVLNGPYTMLKPFQRHQTIAVHHQKRKERVKAQIKKGNKKKHGDMLASEEKIYVEYDTATVR